MHLRVNGRRAEDLLIHEKTDSLPRFVVDRDQSRKISRWSAPQTDSWTRGTDRRWSPRSESEPTWLVYSHESVYDKNRASGVLDDYQYNVGVARQLESVDRFSLSGHCQCADQATIEVAFWSSQRTVIAILNAKNEQSFATSYYQAVEGDDLPLNEQQPVAIRVKRRIGRSLFIDD